MGFLVSTLTLKLNDNKFEGELPSSMKNCRSLLLFDIGENQLSGLIPKWLGVGLPNLAILIFRSNHFYGSIPLELCHLTQMQILDLSMNNIWGSIPKCLNNLTTLAQKGYSNILTISHSFDFAGDDKGGAILKYDDEVSLIWKGAMSKYKSTLGLLKTVDLASNRLSGEIPSEIAQLSGLVSLNLSRNKLTGQITPEIGKLQSLDSLDISRNQIDGAIPTSLAQIDRLAYLDLSYNNLSGEIPTGTQLQTFEAAFVGNPQLCGPPLHNSCSQEEASPGKANLVNQEDKKEVMSKLGDYISMVLGFVVGFWGACGSLIFIRSWRYAYFNFFKALSDWFSLRLALIRRRAMK
ncbi:receptor-like protein EIX2 [Rosa rugosa]|uniref:receptor-like protein EIX2 n=1 Tax=Rosa rugosa TaxID=74645 RepID=UPI002B40D1D4|nr:receptor-like protein EIX2 [Rosa rugosa]